MKIFEFSFILDQPQVCISNRLGDRACQSEPLFCKNAHFSIGLKVCFFFIRVVEMKRIELEICFWRHFKENLKLFYLLKITSSSDDPELHH